MVTESSAEDRAILLKQRLSRYAVVISIVLMTLKFWAWTASRSLAILSDALNSMLDIFSYGTLAISVRIQDLEPDNEHPFGHRRAEPLASMLIAVLATLLGFNLVKDGILGLISPPELSSAPVALVVMIIAISTKIAMVVAYRIAWKQTNSLALHASLVDSRNDILATSVALFGYAVGGKWDALAAIGIGVWVIISGIRIGVCNLDYLMGRAPAQNILEHMRQTALEIPGVEGVHDVIAHYVGDRIHVEVHAEVSEQLDIQAAHDIETELRLRLEKLPEVGRAFIHLDPVGKNGEKGSDQHS